MPAATRSRVPKALPSNAVPGPGSSPTPEEVIAAARADARSLFEEGSKLTESGEYGAAFDTYLRLRGIYGRELDPTIQQLVIKARPRIEEIRHILVSGSIYTDKDNPSPEAAVVPQLPMRETAITEDDLITLIRNLPNEKRTTAADLLRSLLADGSRETTGRATAELRHHGTTPPPALAGGQETSAPTRQEVTEGRDRLRLVGLELRLKQRLNDTLLPTDGLKNREQYRAAGQLEATFRDIAKLQGKLGLLPTPKPPAVKEAQRLRTAFDRQNANPKSKAKRPSRTRQKIATPPAP